MNRRCRCGHLEGEHDTNWCLTLSQGRRECEASGCTCTNFVLLETIGEAIKRMYPDDTPRTVSQP